ncbi:hypothetical protein E8E13_010453 [Curvularia kusanoi]|uniref:Alpha-glucosidase n=1 Tax=Curvularia kusanoi TaxID=90978 RepID=A0A9P4TNL8_CURKU|nr:hypothetical protein E8E13_010453 [Curvularia kusanoi]
MPSLTSTFLHGLFLLLAGFLRWGSAAPVQTADVCPGYKASNVVRQDSSITADLVLAGSACNLHGQDLQDLRFLAEWQTDSRLHVMIYDQEEQVYQVPDFVVPRPSGSSNSDESLLDVSVEENPFSFTVTRKSNNEVLFSTKGSNMIFESQYLRLRTSLPEDPFLYGLGEHTDSLRLPTSNYTRTLWARDAGAVPLKTNLYGTHPVYFEHRADSGLSHGVLLLNSNGMDIKINDDDGQYLEYNTLGGIFDFYFMAGPRPFDVAREYSDISQRAAMMPFGYKSIGEVAAVVANYSAAGIPLETMWTDIDYMDKYKVFTLGQNFPLDKVRDLVSDLHSKYQHYIVMVDPAVAAQDYGPYNRGIAANAFLQTSAGVPWKGEVWPGTTVFPDWFATNAHEYWDNEFASFFDKDSGVDIDALWIDMNEPSSFCNFPCDQTHSTTDTQSNIVTRQSSGNKKGLPGRDLINPSYKIQNAAGSISNKTTQTDLIHAGGWTEYDTHNLYGTMMSAASHESMLKRRPDKRPMVITRSTFVGAGSYVGHWLGDNLSAWDQYLTSIRHLLQFVSFFQVPMAGADVCGFLSNTNEHLCARWTVLGAWYPFYRNHNVDGAIPQEAYRWKSVTEAAKKAIDMRYRLLDYIYTAMHRQTVDGTPMLAPLWMHYPNDSNTFAIETQFFYGPSLMVNPVTQEDSSSVSFYVPSGVWYDLFTRKSVNGSGSTITYSDVPDTDIPVLVHGGSIIPMRAKSANTTRELRDQPFELLIAPEHDGSASGTLYLDDGENLEQSGTSEIQFTFDGSTLKAEGTFGFPTILQIKHVTVMGSGDAKTYELNKDFDGGWSTDLGGLTKL